MTKKYQPSNGMEGMDFFDKFCVNCEKDRAVWEKEDYENGCKIIAKTFRFNPNDPDYPSEWIYDEHDLPICTAFEPVKE